jgi:hypothetical protein
MIRHVELEPRDVFCIWLECEEKTCELKLPLYGQWSASATEEDCLADARFWVWSGLTCPAGHIIRKPAD